MKDDSERDALNELVNELNSYSDGNLLDLASEWISSMGSEAAAKIRAVIASLNAGAKAKAANLLRQQLIRDAADILLNWSDISGLDYAFHDGPGKSPVDDLGALIESDFQGIGKIPRNDGSGGSYFKVEDIFNSITNGSYEKDKKTGKVTAKVFYGDYTITIKYDLNDVETKKNKKVDGSSINASIVGTTSGAGRISGHIKIFYSKGSEYMDASDLDNYFKKVENQIKLWEELKPAPPLPDRPEKFVKFQKEGFQKDKEVLTPANLTSYYFETEEDAVYAFGVVYGGRGQIIEYGAVVSRDGINMLANDTIK